MPWIETGTMESRQKFIQHWKRRDMPFSRLCEAYGVSRKTGYKWIGRYDLEGIAGLADRSRAPLTSPLAIEEDIREILVQLRGKHPFWGPRKILNWLERNRPSVPRPAASTVGDLFKRRGLVRERYWRSRIPPRTQPFESINAPNDTWCTDFKGEFTVGDGVTCYPLTITDAFSRYLIRSTALRSTATVPAQSVFRDAFEEYGLPDTIRSDNGQPFGAPSVGARALSRLGAWFIKLGIRPERITPGNPQQNGRHERMHWTLKQETALPPRSSFITQQRAFDRFRDEYNHQRPHEALEGAPPASIYRASKRRLPRHIRDVAYPTSFSVRRVKHNGEIHCGGNRIFLSEVLVHEPVGLLEQVDGTWEVYFGPMNLGIINERRDAYLPRETPIWNPAQLANAS
jgi:putative transposase